MTATNHSQFDSSEHSAVLAPGFKDPVDAAQGNFRAILEVMSRPGTTRKLSELPGTSLSLSKASTAVALTLLDADTSYWLSPREQDEQLRGYLAFHTGAPSAKKQNEAQFVFLSDAQAIFDFTSLKAGTPEYPDRSATVIIEAGQFGQGPAVELSGPGIQSTTSFSAENLNKNFWEQAQQNAKRFPLGVDFIFTSNDSVAALPRSTQVRF